MEDTIRALSLELESTKALLGREEEKEDNLLSIDNQVKQDLGLDKTFDLDATAQTIQQFVEKGDLNGSPP